MQDSSSASADGERSVVDVRLIERQPAAVAMAVAGELTFSSADLFQDDIVRLLSDTDRHLVLDFGQVTFLDSSAVRAIVALAQRMRERDGKVALVGLTGGLKHRFEMLGLGPWILVCPTLEDALEALTARRTRSTEPD